MARKQRLGSAVIGLAAAAALVAAALFVSPWSASAQETTDAPAVETPEAVAGELAPLTAEERSALIGHLTDEQARDLLLYYLAQNAPAAPTGETVTTAHSTIEIIRSNAAALRSNLSAVLGRSGAMFSEYGRLMEEKLGVDIGGGGFVEVVLFVLALAVVGGLLEFLYRYLTRGLVARNEAGPAVAIRDRLVRAFIQFGRDLGAILAFAIGFAGTYMLIWTGNVERRDFIVVVLLAILLTRISVAIVRVVFLPKHPQWRIMPVDDEAAAHFVRGTRRQVILGAALLLFCTLGHMWGIDPDAWRFSALASGAIFTASVLAFLTIYRHHLRRMVGAAISDGSVPRWAEGAAGWGWYALAVGYVVVAFVVGAYNLLLGIRFEPFDAAVGFLILFVFNPYLTALATGLLAPEPEEAARRAVAHATGLEGAEAAAAEAAVAAAVESSPVVASDRRVMRRVISGTVLVLSLAVFAAVIGINIFSSTDDYPVAKFIIRVLLNVGVIALLGYVGWAFIAAWIDRKLAEEQAKSPVFEHPEEGPPTQGGTRLQTILPIIRKFVQISIAVIAVMVVLASMGVNIAPLIAGAGVIGLAVGFGSQTLVKDLISGLFFLMDDAFRIGEFIEAGSVAGTVERFNARSLVLRGYLGAVYTVPYGDLGKVTNYSRDWVIMKLRFRVPYDADLDLVRKLFKKIGQEMMEDPELGPNFIQPFKSQGVIKMDDSAFIVSGKFMTKPNKQWGVRKAVYEKVQQAFRDHGIKFAPKRVIVDVPQAADFEEDEEELADVKPAATADTKPKAPRKSSRRRAAVAAAAAAAAQEEEE